MISSYNCRTFNPNIQNVQTENTLQSNKTYRFILNMSYYLNFIANRDRLIMNNTRS